MLQEIHNLRHQLQLQLYLFIHFIYLYTVTLTLKIVSRWFTKTQSPQLAIVVRKEKIPSNSKREERRGAAIGLV